MKHQHLLRVFMLTLLVSLFGVTWLQAQEAYAVYDNTNKGLRFYYDTYKNNRTGQKYSLNTGNSDPGWVSDGNRQYVTYVSFDESFKNYRPTSTAKWFYKMYELEEIYNLNYLYTGDVTTMHQMFQECEKLTSLNFQDTYSASINSTNGTIFNTSKVTDMGGMFLSCRKLWKLDLSGWNTSRVTNMSNMFDGCSQLAVVKLGSVGALNVRGGWNTSKVTDMTFMFYNCTNLYDIYVGPGWTVDNVTSSANMFKGDIHLRGGNGTSYSADYTDKTRARVDKSGVSPGYLTSTVVPWVGYTSNNKTLTFYYNEEKDYDVSNKQYSFLEDHPWKELGSEATTVVFDPSFAGYEVLAFSNTFADFKELTSVRGLENVNTSQLELMGGMFLGCKKLTEIDLSAFNTPKLVSLIQTFYGCTSLKRIFVGEGWTTAKVRRTEDTFKNCTSLVGGAHTAYDPDHVDADYARIDGSSTPGYLTGPNYAVYDSDTKTLTLYNDGKRYAKTGAIYEMFASVRVTYPAWIGCGPAQKVVIDPSFATARPTSTVNWFSKSTIESITGMQYLNTSEVTNMYATFQNASSLKEIDLGHFDTHNVNTMNAMFNGCGAEELDLSTFNTGNVTNMKEMFKGCSNLKTIVASSAFTTDKVKNSDDMFLGCTRLTGSAGTRYDANHVDKEYARQDGGENNPGYFSDLGYVVVDGYMMTFFYDQNRSRRSGMVYSLNKTNMVVPDWTQGDTDKITNVVFDSSFANARPVFGTGWFKGMNNLKSFSGLEYLNTSEMVDMTGMFDGCSSLTALNLSNFDTRKVESMQWMFRGCTALTKIIVGEDWTTEGLVSYNGGEPAFQMFTNCTSLVGGIGTAYDAQHVNGEYARVDRDIQPGYLSYRGYAIYYDGTLTFYYDGKYHKREGKVYNFDYTSNSPGWSTYRESTEHVVFDPSFADCRPTKTSYWFYFMTSLKDIEGMEYLNTSRVEYMSYMFYNYPLTTLDISYFDTDKVKRTDGMFQACYYLKTITVGNNWSMASVTYSADMFKGSTKLVGGKGTTYNSSHVDAAYAHVDGGPSTNPGYLTEAKKDSYQVNIAGKAITAANYKLITPSNGFTGVKGGKVTFDPETRTLTLTDATLDYTGVVINNQGDALNIVLEGDNIITAGNYGIWSVSDLNISGSGSATMTAGKGCVYVYNSNGTEVTLTISDCSVNASGKYGIHGYGNNENLIIDNATIHATGTSTSIGYFATLQLKGCAITQPEGATFDNKHLRDAGGNIVTTEVIIEPVGLLKGDVNGDGQVGIGDIVAVTNVMAGAESDPIIRDRADVNGDTEVGIGDIVAITNIMAGVE